MEKETIKVVVVAGVIIKKDSKYLLVQEKKPSAYKLWNLPAGRVDVGETIEEAAVREAKEETGFDCTLLQKVGVFQDKATDAVKHVFTAKIVGGELSIPDDQMLDAKWLNLDEIRKVSEEKQTRGKWVLESVLRSEELN